MIVIGILDERVRERLIRESELTLKRAIEIGQSSEQTKQHSEVLRHESEIAAINKIFLRNTIGIPLDSKDIHITT